VSSDSTEVAFGLTPYLNQFALNHGAIPYWKWAQEGIAQQPAIPRNMHRAFDEMAQNARLGRVTAIHFNLDGIKDPVVSADVAAQSLLRQQVLGLPVNWPVMGLTNAKLNAIRSDPDLLQMTTFYRSGKPVSSPF
jgi:hypothetical protein